MVSLNKSSRSFYFLFGILLFIPFFGNAQTAPTSISGSNVICAGNSTTLTSSGGTTGSNVIDVWYLGAFDEAFSQGWETQPYNTNTSTVNSNSNGILNVTSTGGGDAQITMDGLGSFNPSVYKYINFRYRVVSGTAGSVVIYFLNTAITGATAGYAVATSLISDNNWHVATLNMSAHANWTDSNITGWRFDYTSNVNVTMDIDFIQLGSTPIIGTGTSISVAPTVSTTYSVNRKGPSANTAAISQLITVNALPIPTFTAQADNTVIDTDVSYTTQSGQSNYVWTIPGILNTDYSISSGGASTDNTIVLKWLKNGSKAVQINYTNSNNCQGATATSSNSINARNYGITKNGLKISNPANSINQYGAAGSGKSVSIYGEIMDTPLPPITPSVTSTTGKIWMDRNLGATQVATSSTDAASYGDLYQWGRGTDGHQIRTSNTTIALSSTDTPGNALFITTSATPNDWRSGQNVNLWQGVSGINNPCPSGYRLPTITELYEERSSWDSFNADGAFASPLKLPKTGYRDLAGSLNYVDNIGYYWSSTVSSTNAEYLRYNTSDASKSNNNRAYAFSVRCIKDY